MAMPLHDVAGLASNAQSLNHLRAQAKADPDKALSAAAKQFEAVFLNMMLKSMRDATPQDGLFDNEQTKMFTSMLDQQLAQEMSQRGIGLADIMVRQLSGQGGVQPAPPVTLQADTTLGIYGPSAATTTPAAPVKSAVPSAFNETAQQSFVRRMTPYALKASQESGVPAQLMLGQAALESGWGRREIRMADGSNSYNLFGIKATGNWNGKVAEIVTTEYRNGVAGKEVQKFRAYNSYEEAFSDYARLLSKNPRYAPALQPGQDPLAIAQAIQRGGYATDPNYANKLAKVMGMIGEG